MRQGNRASFYWALIVALTIHFGVMYFVTYARVATLDHFHFNPNTSYMTLMMVTPLALILLVAIRRVFTSPPANIIVGATAVAVFAVGLVCVRTQSGVDDADLLRSMIPHHSGAIMMCRQAPITDPQVAELCRGIVVSHEREIAQMETILAGY